MSGSKNVVLKTEACDEEYNFTWEVSNFTPHRNGLRSAEFFPSRKISISFAVTIQFDQNDDSAVCNFFLCKCPGNEIPETTRIRCVTSIEDSQGSLLVSGRVTNFSLHGNTDFQLYVKTAYLFQYFSSDSCFFDLTDGKIVVKCYLKLYGHCVTSTSTANTMKPHDPTMNWINLSGDFKAIYESKLFSDLTINIDGGQIRAHKLILSSRSPVFKKMMENDDWKESTSKSIAIGDADFETFDCFLRYLYSGCMGDSSFYGAWKLYALADKYSVTGLQKESGRILGSNLSAATVCGVLVLAYLHNDTDLKETAIKFIAQQFSKVQLRLEWAEILKKYPELASQVLGSVASPFGGPKKLT